MPKLLDSDVQTREVLDWSGVHLLHFMGSSCSQKTRIFLNLKGIEWTSHHVDLARQENYTDWFMGINPRGLVPVLVHDGAVIIESNDILEYLEASFPDPVLIPHDQTERMHQLLAEEDALHMDLRALSMRFLFGPGAIRSSDQLQAYRDKGSGKVGGADDPHKEVELKFFQDMLDHGGVTDAQAQTAVSRFHKALSGFDQTLERHDYLLGGTLTLLDIAWYIYAVRLVGAGYPLHTAHPRLGGWFNALHARPEFSKEVMPPPPMIEHTQKLHAEQKAAGQTLVDVASGVFA